MVKRPPAGTIPDAPGSYQFKDVRRPRHLRRQGVEPPPAPLELLPGAAESPSPHPPDGRDRGVGRVDDGAQRGRGVDARVLVDQAAQPAVQRPVARRQELSVPRGDGRRGVATGARDARPQAQGHAVLRAVRPRVRDPRDARSPAAQLPDPHVQPGEVQPAPAARPTVPAVPHREVRRAVRRRDRSGVVPAARRRVVRLPGRRHRRDRQAARDRDAGGGERARVRAGGAPARSAHRRAQGDRQAADGRRPQRGHRCDRHRRGRSRSGGAGVLRPPRPGRRPQGVRARQGRGADARQARRPHPRGDVRRRTAHRGAEAGAGAGRARRSGHVRGVALVRPRSRECRSASRSVATSDRCSTP